jgi:DNA-binding transcriptional LysR family regulator
VPIHPRLIVSTAEAAIDAAIAGVGITSVLSYQIESALRAGALRLLLESFELPPLPVSFLYSSQGRLQLKLRALLDYAAPRLRIRLQQAQATSNQAAQQYGVPDSRLAISPRCARRRRT